MNISKIYQMNRGVSVGGWLILQNVLGHYFKRHPQGVLYSVGGSSTKHSQRAVSFCRGCFHEHPLGDVSSWGRVVTKVKHSPWGGFKSETLLKMKLYQEWFRGTQTYYCMKFTKIRNLSLISEPT